MNQNNKPRTLTALEKLDEGLGEWNPLDDDETLTRIRLRLFGSAPDGGPGKKDIQPNEKNTD